MSIARRTFLKSAAKTTISAGIAVGSAQLIFGQKQRVRTIMEEETPTPKRIPQAAEGYFPIPWEAQESDLFNFRSSSFTPYVGDIFQIPNAVGEMITLRLVSVVDYKVSKTTRLANRKSRPTESFSLTFTAAEKLPPFTSIHRMYHPALGHFDLFLTSRQRDDGNYTYEAVFNHIQ